MKRTDELTTQQAADELAVLSDEMGLYE